MARAMAKKLSELAFQTNSWPDQHIIGLDENGSVSWAQLCKKQRRAEKQLTHVKNSVVIVQQHNAFDFVALLFATWRTGKVALIPHNQLSTTQELISEQFDAYWPTLDFFLGNSETITNTLPSASHTEHDTALIIFTSGSSGSPTAINKIFRQLDNEIQTLEQQWRKHLKNSVIVSTVSLQHIYGMLFRLLWPICCGHRFEAYEHQYWENLLRRNRSQTSALAIVSSPAHLSRIPDLAWPVNLNVQSIFSSGAPLNYEDALNTETKLQQMPIEVYGSSETGGIGWRQQKNNRHWQAFGGIETSLSEQSMLVIRSPHLPDNKLYPTMDYAKLENDNYFSLHGRADRIVKVAEKRISLTNIEKKLNQHEFINEARILPLTNRSDRLGAVIVLNGKGNHFLIDRGKYVIDTLFSKHLTGDVEAVSRPRYWRYLARFPTNQLGKTTQDSLVALFSSQEKIILPIVINREVDDASSIELIIHIPHNLYYFDGHFPGRPILPGIVQTHWVIHYTREKWGEFGRFHRLEAIKFHRGILPKDTVTLSLNYCSKKNKIIFAYTSFRGNHSSGRVTFQRNTHKIKDDSCTNPVS